MIKVIRAFIDRDTLERFNPGDKYPSDNPERVNQLIERGYLTAAKEPTKAEPKETKETKTEKKPAAKSTRSRKKE